MDSDSLFQQTLREQDAIFYATFPAAAASKRQEEAHYEDVPPLEHAHPPVPVPDRPRHALHPAHPYHQFSARHMPPPPPPPDQVRLHAHPAMRLSPLPRNKHQPLDKKPPLACLFCRGRKIACGSPLPGSPDKTCKSVLPFVSPSLVLTMAAVSASVAPSSVNTPQRADAACARKNQSMCLTPPKKPPPPPILPHPLLLPESLLALLSCYFLGNTIISLS